MLIVVGTVFFNILMVADVARAVPRELINVSYTLGAGRLKVLRRVIFPHSLPGMIDVARINLAAAWLMLVVAELLAAPDGLAYRITRAQRFRQVDRMFALLIIFGLIGVVSDLVLRWLRDRVVTVGPAMTVDAGLDTDEPCRLAATRRSCSSKALDQGVPGPPQARRSLALDGIDLPWSSRRVRLPRRRLGLRQVDAAQHRGRARGRHRAAASRSTARR